MMTEINNLGDEILKQVEEHENFETEEYKKAELDLKKAKSIFEEKKQKLQTQKSKLKNQIIQNLKNFITQSAQKQGISVAQLCRENGYNPSNINSYMRKNGTHISLKKIQEIVKKIEKMRQMNQIGFNHLLF